MPFLNDPSRILTNRTFETLNKNIHFEDKDFDQKNNELNGGFFKDPVNKKRIMTYDFTSDSNYNFKYHLEIVDSILQDESRWDALNVKFVPFWKSSNSKNERKADVNIHLSNDKTIKKECGFEGLSCAMVGGNNIYLNETNWLKGSSKSKLSLEEYRKYVLTHEMCHILGYLHEECTGKGNKVSILQQQTVGIGDCVPFGGNIHFNSTNPPKVSTQWD
jgi:hypothetical protein